MLTQKMIFLFSLLFSVFFIQAQNLTVEGKVRINGERLEFDFNGYDNIFIGAGVGTSTFSNSLANNNNIGIGHFALNKNVQGRRNIAIVRDAMFQNNNGFENVAVGEISLFSSVSGTRNVAIGYNSFSGGVSYTNSTAIGFSASVGSSNQIRLGNSTVSSIGGFEPWSNISDKRLKRKVQQDIPGLAFITQLRPVSYQLDMERIAKWHNTPDSLRDFKSEAVKGNIRYSGFLAQEVEATAQEIGYDFSGVDAPTSEEDRYALRYSQFVVPLVKAVQELDAENQLLRKELAEIKDLLLADRQAIELRSTTQKAILNQNAPNPFNGYTTINYFIPDDFQRASIRIADSNGQLIKEVAITESGRGQIDIDATQLNNGNYFYALILDGKLVESKQMIRLNNE
ncbi:MAG: tail fiber domain-containing protein [Bacteroidota bacterium]